MRGRALDVVIVVVALAVTALVALLGRVTVSVSGGAVLLLLAPALLLVRRRYPVTVLVATMACTWLYFWLGYPELPIFLAPVVALYTVADLRGPLTAFGWSALAIAGTAWQGLTSGAPPGDLVMITGWLLLVVASGTVTRNRRAFLEAARRHGATEERLRIARDLHDMVGHHLSLTNVQAGAALHRIRDRPEKAAEALAAIKETSGEALRELRATVVELREGERPGLARIRHLVERSGLDVRLDLQEAELPAETDLAAYRIVQEALTNIARHAKAAKVAVAIAVQGKELVVDIGDDGQPEAGWQPGSGLRGMDERVAALGGFLTYGPREDGPGFRVLARLPVRETR